MAEINIKKILNTLSRKRPYHYEHSILTPRKDWAVIFSAFIFFVIAITAFNSYIFYRIDKGEGFLIDLPFMKVETINKTTLQNIIDVFDTRAEKLSNLKSDKPLNPDPTF